MLKSLGMIVLLLYLMIILIMNVYMKTIKKKYAIENYVRLKIIKKETISEMNKTQLTRLRGIKQRLRMNSVNMEDLIRWCEDYKSNQIVEAFTLKWSDVLFVISNLEEIKSMESE